MKADAEERERELQELRDDLLGRLEGDGAGRLEVFSTRHFWKCRVTPSAGGIYSAHGSRPLEAMAGVERKLREQVGAPAPDVLDPELEPVDSHAELEGLGLDGAAPEEEGAARSQERSVLPLVATVERMLLSKVQRFLERESYRRAARAVRETFDPDGRISGHLDGRE